MCIRTNTVLTRIVLSLAAVVWLFNGTRTVQAEDKAGRSIALETVYLTETVGRAHGISIVGRAPGKAKVTLDPNACGINVFGDRTMCTLMAMMNVDVEIVRIRLEDKSGQGRAIYELKGNLPPKESRWYLVGPPRGGKHYRLVVQASKDMNRPITLEPRRSVKPALCKKVKYQAAQSGGEVTIVAWGSNPTEGYKVRFEKLAITIFPPQFRLFCIKPTGNVAQVVTPFEVKTSFRAEEPIKQVIVHDADGKHEVSVKQVVKKKG